MHGRSKGKGQTMNIAVILSGGSGSRVLNTSLPKQYIKVAGKMIVEHTIEIYQNSNDIDAIVLVVNNSYIDYMKSRAGAYPKLIKIIEGGNDRIHSVLNAVIFLNTLCKPGDKIIIADSVRPCVLKRDIHNIMDELNNYECATTGIECYETLFKSGTNMETESIIPRDRVYRQTSPEGYKFEALKFLYLDADEETICSYKNIGLDRLHSLGRKVKIVKCYSYNFKITTNEDVGIFEAMLLTGMLKDLDKP